MSALRTTVRQTGRDAWLVVVDDGAGGRAQARLSGPDRHAPLALDLDLASVAGTTGPDPFAWPRASATAAAALRRHDRHPTLVALRALDVEGGLDPRAALEAVGAALVDRGVRRIDLIVHPSGPARGPRWVHGPNGDGDGDLASLVLRYPWSPTDGAEVAPGRPSPLDRLLPARGRRWRRRIAAVRPAQVPELARTLAGEVQAAARHRYAPGGARSAPGPGAPDGTFPFAVTRHRTLDQVLALVPAPLRGRGLLDVGCGDGRVLLAAAEAGFGRLVGWELDPALAALAAERAAPAEVLAIDALDAPVPTDVGVVFLNNPFDAARTARFAAQLGASLRSEPRPLLLVYVNPRPIEPFEAAGLVLVHAAPTCSVLATAGPT